MKMKKSIAILLTALLLCCLAGCAAAPVQEPAPETTAADTVSIEIAPAVPAQSIRIVTEKIKNNDKFASACLVIRGLDAGESEVWSYRSADCAQTELEVVQLIAETDTAVYLNEQGIVENGTVGGGRITALEKQTGKVLWQNTKFDGASVYSCFDRQGTLYCGGYYGPDCMAIDADGNTLWVVYAVDDACWWPHEIRFADDILTLTYEGTESGTEETRCLTTDGKPVEAP